MPDWNSPDEISFDHTVYLDFCLCLLGLYFWDVVNTLYCEWNIASRRIRWRWPMAFIEASRASMITLIVTNFVLSYTNTGSRCAAITRLGIFCNCVVYMCATAIFGLRAVGVYSFNKGVIAALGLVLTGQFITMIGQMVTSNAKAGLSDEGTPTCEVPGNHPWFAAMITSMLISTVFFFGATVARLRQISSDGASVFSIIFKDGLYFFLLAIVAVTLDVGFFFAQWNTVMKFMVDLATSIVVSLASTRAAISLCFGRNDNLAGRDEAQLWSQPASSGTEKSGRSANTSAATTSGAKTASFNSAAPQNVSLQRSTKNGQTGSADSHDVIDMEEHKY